MKKYVYILLLTTLLTACSETSDTQLFIGNKDTFIKSAHYFSSAWPKTFWQDFEEDDVDSELKKIKADGFNTVVLTVPWRGFETGFENNRTQSNKALYQRLEFLLESIKENDLLYILRLGFPHDYTPNTGTNGMEQCIGIYTDSKMQNHWQDYLHKVFNTTKPYHLKSAGIIISWEDFWCPHFVFPNQSEEKRLEMAQAMGYGDWLKTKDSQITQVLLQASEVKYEAIKVPKPTDLSYALYLQFIDQMLDVKVLQPTKMVFPNAALEIRVDKFPIKHKDHYSWISHDLYFQEKNHRGTYWAPFWGANNNGELLSATQALKNFEYFLKVVTNQGANTNHVIEQFNFYDNTPYFPNNANIKPDEIDDFLLGAAPLLKDYSQGFGVWAYWDYQDNGLYNGSFEMNLQGWQVNGEAHVLTVGMDQQLQLTAGSSIEQSFIAGERLMLAGSYESLKICLDSNSNSELTLTVDKKTPQNWSIKPGKNCTQINAAPFKKNTPTKINILTNKTVEIDELNLSGFTQRLGLYDAEGNPGQNLKAYRKLNAMFD